MTKQRPVPIYTIEGTTFFVEVDKQVLRQTNDPGNEISFIHDMVDEGARYRLFYDPERKNIPRQTDDPRQLKEIQVPPLVALDPDGMAAAYGTTVEQLKGKTDFEVIVDQELLALRHQGALPQIDIAGERFIVDVRLQELRHALNFHPAISLKSFELTNDGWKYEAFYHPVIRQVVGIDPKLTEFPDGVVKIQLPNEIGLDPVAVARRYGIDEHVLLRRHPIQKALKAKVIPLSETGVPALIRHNREELQQQHREIVRRIRPKHRPRF
jgi:hypothetical protein